MAEDLKPTAPQQPPAPVAPIAHRLLATGEVVSLALAVLTLVGCAATLFAFLGTAVIQAGTVTPPRPPGTSRRITPISRGSPRRSCTGNRRGARSGRACCAPAACW